MLKRKDNQTDLYIFVVSLFYLLVFERRPQSQAEPRPLIQSPRHIHARSVSSRNRRTRACLKTPAVAGLRPK